MRIKEIRIRDVVRIRKVLGMSQAELARRIGCSPAFVNQVEAGVRKPSAWFVRSMAEELMCRVEDIAVLYKEDKKDKEDKEDKEDKGNKKDEDGKDEVIG